VEVPVVPVEPGPVVEVPVVPVEPGPVVEVPVVPVEPGPVVEVPVESGRMPSSEREPSGVAITQAGPQALSGGLAGRNPGYGVQTAAAVSPSAAPLMAGLAVLLLACSAVATRTTMRWGRRRTSGT
ncbi:hypothetical protein ACFWIX_09745, partial [Pseudarthrobacter sp. NPDC058362]|uniref:hypothetical protein n=1 Tax=Pseudarthrobacter sp. NPDC058362 TaxID=3346458 RepID=UPI00365AD369